MVANDMDVHSFQSEKQRIYLNHCEKLHENVFIFSFSHILACFFEIKFSC